MQVKLMIFMAVATALSSALPAVSQEAGASAGTTCADMAPSLMRKACQESLELLMTEEKQPDITLAATYGNGRWEYTYYNSSARSGLTQCSVEDGAQVLLNSVAELRVTSLDDIVDVEISGHGITFSAIPGRVNVIEIPTSRTVTLFGNATKYRGGETLPIKVTVSERADYTAWEKKTLENNCAK